jgi:hypothetical protein
MPYGPLPTGAGEVMPFTGTTVLQVENGLITEEPEERSKISRTGPW